MRHWKPNTTGLTWTAIALLVALQTQLLPPDQTATVASNPSKLLTQSRYGVLPLAFEPNVGQAGERADFIVHHGTALTVFDGLNATTSIHGRSVTMALPGATAQLKASGELGSTVNYLRGNDPAAWRQQIKTYGSVAATDVYPGIDLRYYGTNSQLEHDFIVNPGADYRQIALVFTGQDAISLDDDGNVVLQTGDDTLALKAPTTYQEYSTSKHTIPSHFQLAGDTVTFAVADTYDPTQPLVIDPVLSLVYSTYFGGSGADQALRIALDRAGNAYLTGQTDSTDLLTASPVQPSNAGGTDVFVAKLSPDGQALDYATYLGGSSSDTGYGIDVDQSGNAYVAGETSSSDFPTASAYQAAKAGGTSDAFLVKLNPSGSSILFATYLGGSNPEGAQSLHVDQAGRAYLAGYTQSTDFPLETPYQNSLYNTMAFATKFAADGQSLVYSTYLGGGGDTIDISYYSALGNDGSFYLAGSTTTGGGGFPTVNAFQPSHAGGDVWDMFVTKFAPDGQSLEYSTYLGGSGEDGAYIGCDVAVDDTGSAYVVGSTSSTDFPLSTPFQAAHAGGATYDGFLTKFSPDGQSLEYSTYLGGTDDDLGVSVAVDPSYHAHVLSTTRSADFPTKTPFQAANAGDHDASITKFTPDGQSLDYSTYFGSGSTDYASMIALDVNGDVYVTGYSDGGDIPLKNPIRATNPGGSDAFITQLTENAVTVTGIADALLTFSLGSTTCDLGHFSPTETKFCTHTLSVSTNATGGYSVSYIPTTTLTSGANTITPLAIQTGSTTGTSQFGLNLAANTASGSNTASDFGAVPTGGAGTAASGYQTGDLFKFATAGDTIAGSAGPSLATVFTASFIANVELTTAAGTYTAPITYNVVASY